MGGEGADGAARDCTELFERGKNFFHAGDGGAGERFAVENYIQAAVGAILNFHCFGILAGTTEKKFAQAIPEGIASRLWTTQKERAGTIAK